jgi:hypothetical protein
MRNHYIFDLLNLDSLRTMYRVLTKKILTVTGQSSERQEIASKPHGLALCDDSEYSHTRSIVVHRGERFRVSVLAIAQGNITTSTSVTALTSQTGSLKFLQNPQHLPHSLLL